MKYDEYGIMHDMDIDINQIIELVKTWALTKGPGVIGIILVSWALSRWIKVIITKIIRKAVQRHTYDTVEAEKKREDTLIRISHNVFRIFIWVAAFIGVLFQFGIPIAPFLTGAGIVGVAVGFGTQSLVKDIVNGLFIILENQFRIGDIVCIDKEHCGVVEDMTLRITKLREMDGTIHYIPNGTISIASNKSKDYSKVDITIGVGYSTDFDKLEQVINQVGQDLAKDEVFGTHIIEAPAFLRVEEFMDSSINVRIIGTVYPKMQYLISGEMRKRLKQAFDEHNIEIPFPIRVMYTAKENN